MSVSCCYWTLLGLEEFDYLYISDYLSSFILPCGRSPHELLIYQSLFQFIHPDEIEAAKLDLFNFIKIKSLAGAVTRCRLKNINKSHKDEESWIITDIIMYTATTNTILTFFHSHVNEKYSANDIPCCGNGNIYSFKASCIQHILNANTLHPIIPFQNQDQEQRTSFRIFQIHDTNTHELVLSWPPAYVAPTANDSTQSHESFVRLTFDLVQNITLTMMEKKLRDMDSKNMVCAHHSHSNSTVLIDSYGTCEIERIVITYGSLTFSTFLLTPSSPETPVATTGDNYLPESSVTANNTTNLVGSPTMDIPKSWKSRFGAYEKRCEKCQTNTSPEWRKGPSGHKTYCNACGLRYARQIAKQQNDDKQAIENDV